MLKPKVDAVFYVAAAGAGKTQTLVDIATGHDGKVLLTTYTRQNTREINDRIAVCGFSAGIRVLPWYTFLLQQCIQPYQGCFTKKRISGLHWVEGQSGIKRVGNGRIINLYNENEREYYLDSSWRVYSDKMSKLALKIDDLSSGEVVARLARAYSAILVDEVQDMVGYDLELLGRLSGQVRKTIFAGDPRQKTYETHKDAKNKKFSDGSISMYFAEKCKWMKIDTTSLRINYRSNQQICKLADELYPAMPQSVSGVGHQEGHLGVHYVKESEVESYLRMVHPMQLRENVKRVVSGICPVMNFGEAKGRAFEHVLIYPTEPMSKWLVDHSAELKQQARARLYVAITRAKMSVAFVVSDKIAKKLNVNGFGYESSSRG